MDDVKPGIYQHYKGQNYEVIGLATHSETEEAFVVYRALYGDYRLFIRPKVMFVETLEKENYRGPRFKCVKGF